MQGSINVHASLPVANAFRIQAIQGKFPPTPSLDSGEELEAFPALNPQDTEKEARFPRLGVGKQGRSSVPLSLRCMMSNILLFFGWGGQS